jgi:transposase
VGKKNFLFVGHPQAGQRSAVIYSVLGSCRRHGINPAEYLRDLFERLPKAKTSEVKTLTPAAWAKARRLAKRPAA